MLKLAKRTLSDRLCMLLGRQLDLASIEGVGGRDRTLVGLVERLEVLNREARDGSLVELSDVVDDGNGLLIVALGQEEPGERAIK